MITPSKIMDSLRDMFEQKSTQTKLDGLKFIFKTRMKEGTSVWEHVLNMLVHFNVAEMNGAITNEASQVNFLLETLTKSFLQFCRCYEQD